jgi:hypothetical protein
MKKISIGSWAYTIGPYADKPVPWEEVITRLKVKSLISMGRSWADSQCTRLSRGPLPTTCRGKQGGEGLNSEFLFAVFYLGFQPCENR